MKKVFFSMVVALVATVAVQAQKISAVSKEGKTTLYHTLHEAIKGASPGSVIYLPGGSYTIHDSVKITKRLDIIGIGHKVDGENADGNTTISGNLWFNGGSDVSSMIGCYITGNVNIGADSPVNGVLVRHCNLNSVQIKNGNCIETQINQNYIRNTSNCSDSSVDFTNNIMHSLLHINAGKIKNNIFTYWGDAYTGSLNYIYGSVVSNNVINCLWTSNFGYAHFDGTVFLDNMHGDAYGTRYIGLNGHSWDDYFVKCNGFAINTVSDFHFKDEFKEYEDKVGIYAGTGFDDRCLPPTPFIVEKSIPEKTNASGKLNIKIRVKANE